MKQVIILLMAIALVPSAYTQQSYEEIVYIFTVDEGSVMPDDGACAAGVARLAKRSDVTGIDPNINAKFKINTVITREKNAKVNGHGDVGVGELLVCQDWQTYFPETNLAPIYYEITIGGRKFRVIGGGLHPDFPDILPGGLQIMAPTGYPAPGVFPVGITGTVLPSFSPGERGGVYSTNFVVDGSPSGDMWTTESHHILRVLLPVEN